jgi:hypothetical protein
VTDAGQTAIVDMHVVRNSAGLTTRLRLDLDGGETLELQRRAARRPDLRLGGADPGLRQRTGRAGRLLGGARRVRQPQRLPVLPAGNRPCGDAVPRGAEADPGTRAGGPRAARSGDRAAARRRAAGGELLAADGAFGASDDVFYLTFDELQGELPPGYRELIAKRREARERYQSLQVTDPSWGSLMFLSAGLVADIGGTLSHTAVVARELGLPCVVNTKIATATLRTGDMIRLDGSRGRIEILTRTQRAAFG